MSTIQNLKNFIRHGKQARAANPAFADPTTTVSPVQVQQHHGRHQQHAISDPPMTHHQAPAAAPRGADLTVAGNVDNRNVAAQGAAAAAKATADQQRLPEAHGENRSKAYDQALLERMVAEERESKGKFPAYPGLDRWTLIEKMGDGAFSNVYRARDNRGQLDEVAIKVVRKFEMNSSQNANHLHPDFKKQPKMAERSNILKEVQIMRQLDHPNVVKLVEFSESSQYYYIILELCPGGELFHQIVRLTYFSEDLSRHVIVQVAKALDYLHEIKGVVHRDIKPENLLFYPVPFIPTRNPKPRSTEEEDKEDEGEYVRGVGAGGIGRIKIADFGLSKVVWDSQTMTPCGTVGYTAPEIVKDERYSKSVDMWALGCVLYTLLCGFPPFYDESIQVLTEKVARGQYTFLSPWWDDISKSAQDLISHLLTVDPEKRYTIQEFLNHPWVRQSDEATHAAADAPPLATPAWQRQKQMGHLYDPVGTPMAGASHFLETPGAARRMDFRSPAAVNLREVFDVGYAVHRQEEEGKRRKNFKQGYRGAGGAGLTALNALDEVDDDDEDDATDDGVDRDNVDYAAASQSQQYQPPSKVPKAKEADVHQVEQSLQRAHISGDNGTAPSRQQQPQQQKQQQQSSQQQRGGYGQHSAAVAAAARQQARKKQQAGPFELSLNNATLLGRREKREQDPSSLRRELVQ